MENQNLIKVYETVESFNRMNIEQKNFLFSMTYLYFMNNFQFDKIKTNLLDIRYNKLYIFHLENIQQSRFTKDQQFMVTVLKMIEYYFNKNIEKEYVDDFNEVYKVNLTSKDKLNIIGILNSNAASLQEEVMKIVDDKQFSFVPKYFDDEKKILLDKIGSKNYDRISKVILIDKYLFYYKMIIGMV